MYLLVKNHSKSLWLLGRWSYCFGFVWDGFIGLFLPLTTGQEFREEQITFGCAKLNHLYGIDLIFSLLVVSAYKTSSFSERQREIDIMTSTVMLFLPQLHLILDPFVFYFESIMQHTSFVVHKGGHQSVLSVILLAVWPWRAQNTVAHCFLVWW